MNLEFEAVVGTQRQVRLLYRLLGMRDLHNISHKQMPEYREHKKFVEDSGYRYWFLITFGSQCIGSLYLTYSNVVGIFMIKPKPDWYESSLDWVLKNFEPLPPLPSERPSSFHINVASRNKALQQILSAYGAQRIQVTYEI